MLLVSATRTRQHRRRLVRQLVADRDLRSQADVVAALADEGMDATQATVSRDLDDLGAVKVRGGDGELVYRLAADPGAASARARLVPTLQQYVTSVAVSGNLVVLRTPPACAQPVASVVDLSELDGVLATISGDDTVLVVATEAVGGADVAEQLRSWTTT